MKPPSPDEPASPKEPAVKSGISKTYSSKFNPLLLIGLVIVCFGLLLGTFIKLISTVNNQPSSPSTSPTPLPTQIDTPSTTDVITLAKFNQIQNGMSIQQVQELIGSPGKLLGTSNTNNVVGKVYWWQNLQGSNAIVEFRNDLVVSKSQAGLK
jgi:hypothetical protein